MEISEQVKTVAKHALSVIGGERTVQLYIERQHNIEMDVATYVDGKYNDDIISYSTLGLSEYPLPLYSDNKPICVEFVSAAYTRFGRMAAVTAACAFNIIDKKYMAQPGGIYPNMLEHEFPDSDMKHILLHTPYFWDGLETLDFPDKKVAWLMLIPISDDEFYYAGMKGSEALMDLLEEHDVDPMDLYRKSVLNVEQL